MGVGTNFLVAVCILAVFQLGILAAPTLSGSTTLNLSALPVPCTLVDETKLNTPCERTIFSWDLDMAVKLKLSLSPAEILLDAVGGFAGFEHVILGAKAPFGEVEAESELWLAVPFESVADVNNLPNAAVIPPGDMLFAAALVRASWSADPFTINWTTVFQDINFPSPGRDYPELSYGLGDQSFALGSLIRISTTFNGVGLSLQLGLGAEPGSFAVKGYSTSVRAVRDRFFAVISANNITLGCPWCPGGGSADGLRLGLSFIVEPKGPTFLTLRGSITAVVVDDVRVSTSFSLLVPEKVQWGGFSVSMRTSLGSFSIQLDPEGEFRSASLGMSYQTPLNLSWTSGVFFVRATATSQRGISSVSTSLSLSQGTFSSSYNLAYSWQSDRGLAFASFSLRFRINLAPLQVGVGIVFGRYGLGRFTVSTGYVF